MRRGETQFNTGRPYNPEEHNPRSYSHVPNYDTFDVANNHLSHVRPWDSDRSSSIPNNSSGFGRPVYNAFDRTSNSLSSLEVAKNEITSRLSNNIIMRGLIKERKGLQDEEEEQQRKINITEENIGSISSYLIDNRKEVYIFRKKTTMLRKALLYQTGKTFDEYINEYIKEHSGYSSKNDDKLREYAIIQLNKDITNREKTSKTMDNDFSNSTQELAALKVQLTTLLKRKTLAQSRIILNNKKKIDFINEAVNEVLEKKGIILDKEKKDTLVAVIEGIYKVNKVGGYKLIKRVVKRPSKPSAKPVKRPSKPSAKPTKRPSKPSAKPTKRPAKPSAKPSAKPTKRPAKPSAKPTKRPAKPSAKPTKRPVRK
jgi:hypothetical protein